jgi:hypothetical protein
MRVINKIEQLADIGRWASGTCICMPESARHPMYSGGMEVADPVGGFTCLAQPTKRITGSHGEGCKERNTGHLASG